MGLVRSITMGIAVMPIFLLLERSIILP